MVVVSGSTTRKSTPSTMRPTVVRISACSATGSCCSAVFNVHTAAMGEVSVIPQACKMGRPICSRYASLSALGTAAPPHTIARNEDVSRPFNSGSTAIQMVGTPAPTVTFSFTMWSAIALPDKSGPGITKFAPHAVAAWVRPQAFTWNIGTTGNTVSDSRTPSESATISAIVCKNVERCEYTTPLGLPVVPLV